jgi:hypothetical protein
MKLRTLLSVMVISAISLNAQTYPPNKNGATEAAPPDGQNLKQKASDLRLYFFMFMRFNQFLLNIRGHCLELGKTLMKLGPTL